VDRAAGVAGVERAIGAVHCGGALRPDGQNDRRGYDAHQKPDVASPGRWAREDQRRRPSIAKVLRRRLSARTPMSKALLITGGSRGIGRATALLAARRGWSVGVNYRVDAEAADSVVRDIAKGGGRAVALEGDVANEADVVAMFEQATNALGPLTGVVANAGIVAPSARLVDMSAERMRRVFEVNVLGAYLTAREAARRMSESAGGAGGSIVLMSSAAARLGSPNLYVDYAGSKGAIDTLTIGLSRELGPEGVRVNAIRPGLIETEIHASGGEPDRARTLGRSSPLGRPGKAEEIAEAAVWLLSDAASYVTGAILDVTGGR
jgi:NAD(P)-dependent dehydrogenase (short-subunit alcohol dehydrogenase family)